MAPLRSSISSALRLPSVRQKPVLYVPVKPLPATSSIPFSNPEEDLKVSVCAETISAGSCAFWGLYEESRTGDRFCVSVNVEGGEDAPPHQITHKPRTRSICNNCIPCQQWDYRKCAFWRETCVWLGYDCVRGRVSNPQTAECTRKDIKTRKRGRKERRKQ